MKRGVYIIDANKVNRSRRYIFLLLGLLLIGLASFISFRILFAHHTKAYNQNISFDSTVSDNEKQLILNSVNSQNISLPSQVSISLKTTSSVNDTSKILSAYVPVTNINSSKQAINTADLQQYDVFIENETPELVRLAIAKVLNLQASQIRVLNSPLESIAETAIVFIPANKLSFKVKLLSLNNNYYLDSFMKGAVFRELVLSGGGSESLTNLSFNGLDKSKILKINMSGVTALTRLLMVKLHSVNGPKYFSKFIGKYLADADLTHISNEVSFKPGCQVSNTIFCAPPEMIEVLKDSGVDLIELTGNHNNDTGSKANADTIKLYTTLGWHTFGGGLNASDAKKPFVANIKNSKVAFLGYNYADRANNGPIASANDAGSNPFNFKNIQTDLVQAKQTADFVIVDVQYAECYAYPESYQEYPECDGPVPNQQDDFRRIADYGADMVIGTQAHQPQTYELYKDTPIYYGLGNLYFDQVEWPGTERGIILSHYFLQGALLQTKLTPTKYDNQLQTQVMNNIDAERFLSRLKRVSNERFIITD